MPSLVYQCHAGNAGSCSSSPLGCGVVDPSSFIFMHAKAIGKNNAPVSCRTSPPRGGVVDPQHLHVEPRVVLVVLLSRGHQLKPASHAGRAGPTDQTTSRWRSPTGTVDISLVSQSFSS
ncbi:hypothetical protein V6N13_056924 [Hibiscus sabdariffa]|uniref:Uncharacterized protein n=2 Tax=Hibiscus sabdariffa TaxID=183260 RepID=A0ABR2D2D5_9ROSI